MVSHVKLVCILFTLASLAVVASATPARSASKLIVTSSAFGPGTAIPARYSCSSANAQSPPLAWSGVPAAAKTLALIVRDPDAPNGNFIHWVVYNLPASAKGLDSSVPTSGELPNGALQGVNGTGEPGYKGPCPPPGSGPHHYHFELMALDRALDLKPGASAAEVKEAARGHVIASGELIGTFSR